MPPCSLHRAVLLLCRGKRDGIREEEKRGPFTGRADEYVETAPCLCLSLLGPTVGSPSNPVA